ncbi:tRNA lysidine(34) synthetase TilS [Fructobacillus parabroussonetiae]|uniref:tRNA(Ile)-lysidine synthase n=1 Tax=Fructobacillus parabroussonetiae TaxID=2713174 RepID=A0ABS5QVT2_9LACO|nr:tRNA lysidine(34) synthetase TilS [Fructobacillus parabroussonetiae]MBS9337313.1 tRNA lysidine(34) synthetase TilS [Fructobacillus parabroussonetiae]
MQKTIQETIQAFDLPKRVVVGCSGGLDSTVLVDSLHRFRPDVEVVVAHVNYRLRAESDGDADFVKALAADYQMAFEERVADLSQQASAVEEKARAIRFDFFEAVSKAHEATAVVLAQHQNDQVETVLLQMVRGGLLQKKTGMSKRQGRLLRPFLDLPKSALLAYAKEQGLSWREDLTNQDANYTGRNQLRQVVLPALTTVNAQAGQHILQLAEQLQADEALIERTAKHYLPAFERDFCSVEEDWWQPCLIVLAKQAGLYQLTKNQLTAMLTLLSNSQKPQGRMDLADGFYFQKSYQRLGFFRASPEKGNSQEKNKKVGQQAGSLVLELDQWYFWHGLCIRHQSKDERKAGLESLTLPDDLAGPLVLERARQDDQIPLKKGHKSVRRLLIDEKIPAEERPQTDLLKDREKNVLAVFLGQRRWYFTSHWPKDRPSGKQSLVWRIEEN